MEKDLSNKVLLTLVGQTLSDIIEASMTLEALVELFSRYISYFNRVLKIRDEGMVVF